MDGWIGVYDMRYACYSLHDDWSRSSSQLMMHMHESCYCTCSGPCLYMHIYIVVLFYFFFLFLKYNHCILKYAFDMSKNI